MSRIRADNITNKDGTGAPSLSNGAVVAGVLTATSLSVIGIITARTGIDVLAGGINAVGVVTATSFEGSGANLTGLLVGFNELDAALFN